jgi:hypothetical protein
MSLLFENIKQILRHVQTLEQLDHVKRFVMIRQLQLEKELFDEEE